MQYLHLCKAAGIGQFRVTKTLTFKAWLSKTFLMRMSFICMRIENRFYNWSIASNLASLWNRGLRLRNGLSSLGYFTDLPTRPHGCICLNTSAGQMGGLTFFSLYVSGGGGFDAWMTFLWVLLSVHTLGRFLMKTWLTRLDFMSLFWEKIVCY